MTSGWRRRERYLESICRSTLGPTVLLLVFHVDKEKIKSPINWVTYMLCSWHLAANSKVASSTHVVQRPIEPGQGERSKLENWVKFHICTWSRSNHVHPIAYPISFLSYFCMDDSNTRVRLKTPEHTLILTTVKVLLNRERFKKLYQ